MWKTTKSRVLLLDFDRVFHALAVAEQLHAHPAKMHGYQLHANTPIQNRTPPTMRLLHFI
jgi:hypothetical protein